MVGDVDEQTGLPTEHTEDTEDTEDTEENGDSATQRSKVLFSSVRFQPQKLNRRQQRERRVVRLRTLCFLGYWACLEKMDINSGSFDVVFRWLVFEGHR